MDPMDIKSAAGPRPFWVGLDPDKPERLDKILAALHCYHAGPPPGGRLRFAFTVDSDDHHRIHRGFPELKKLAAAIRTEIPFAHVYHLMASGIESARRLPEPVGPLARKVFLGHHDEWLHGFFAASTSCKIAGVTSIIVFATAGNHKGAGTYAQYFTKYPETMRAVVAVNLGLPDGPDSERAVRRLAEFSANHHLHYHPANIVIPYTEILSSLRGTLAGIVGAWPTSGSVLGGGGGGSGSNPGSGNKRSFSTLAGGNKQSFSTLAGGNKQSFSTLAGGSKTFDPAAPNTLLARVSGGHDHDHAVFHPRRIGMQRNLARAMVAPWSRILARIPRKW
ncbi:hypothetical protein B0T25DRAFT_521657 [Lasiosphaeria hispida]|uniref:Uncharacterized protein n=1 Tax=Lasiosphaeria hispida TaxID=260671 RepID=A0AAJ0H822_9PEZI|nr:hypothetical protein B0T25DRAFT_521657 [Lasiosphaeria hispida]